MIKIYTVAFSGVSGEFYMGSSSRANYSPWGCVECGKKQETIDFCHEKKKRGTSRYGYKESGWNFKPNLCDLLNWFSTIYSYDKSTKWVSFNICIDIMQIKSINNISIIRITLCQSLHHKLDRGHLKIYGLPRKAFR